MTDVQRAGNVGRGNDDRKDRPRLARVGAKEVFADPVIGPTRLDLPWFVGFGDLTGHSRVRSLPNYPGNARVRSPDQGNLRLYEEQSSGSIRLRLGLDNEQGIRVF